MAKASQRKQADWEKEQNNERALFNRFSVIACLSEGISAHLKYDGLRGNVHVLHSLFSPFIQPAVVCFVRN